MATMNREIYEALKEAKVSEEKALKAAESVAAFDQKHYALSERLTALEGKVDRIAWMLGANLAATLAVLWKLLQ